MNDSGAISSYIKSLEAQLRVLKAQVESVPQQPVKPGHTFANLYGRLRGQVDSTEDEIDAVLYQFPDDKEDES